MISVVQFGDYYSYSYDDGVDCGYGWYLRNLEELDGNGGNGMHNFEKSNDISEYKVIGNIYENKELLDKKKKKR